jgi:hypothetical protein
MPRALFTSSTEGVLVEMPEIVLLSVGSLERPVGAGVGVAVVTEEEGDGDGVAVGALMGSRDRLSLEVLKGASPLERATMYPLADSETKITRVPEGTVMKPMGRPSWIWSTLTPVRRVPPRVGSADWPERDPITPRPERSRIGRSVISRTAWAWRRFINRAMLTREFS